MSSFKIDDILSPPNGFAQHLPFPIKNEHDIPTANSLLGISGLCENNNIVFSKLPLHMQQFLLESVLKNQQFRQNEHLQMQQLQHSLPVSILNSVLQPTVLLADNNISNNKSNNSSLAALINTVDSIAAHPQLSGGISISPSAHHNHQQQQNSLTAQLNSAFVNQQQQQQQQQQQPPYNFSKISPNCKHFFQIEIKSFLGGDCFSLV